MAREAGLLARSRFLNRENGLLKFKGPHDYLTATDSEVEAIIIKRLGGLFPNDQFLGEESGGQPGAQTWVIDPIDGTENFARGIPHFCISIAFVVDGRCELGVIYNPLSEELWVARKGHGAFINGRPLKPSPVDDLSRATVEVGWSSRRPVADYLALVKRVSDTGASFRRTGSGTLGIAYVADGRVEAYCELHINSWDALAALLMVEEAGGWCNDFLADDGLTQGSPVLATTTALKAQLIAACGFGG